MRAGLLAFALAALTAVSAACGGGYSSPTPNPPANQPPVVDPAGTLITIPPGDGYGNSSFNPANLTVAAGASVTWTNRDTVKHTTQSGTTWSADLEPGASFSRTFAARGTFGYRCTIHTGMTGTIVVQ